MSERRCEFGGIQPASQPAAAAAAAAPLARAPDSALGPRLPVRTGIGFQATPLCWRRRPPPKPPDRAPTTERAGGGGGGGASSASGSPLGGPSRAPAGERASQWIARASLTRWTRPASSLQFGSVQFGSGGGRPTAAAAGNQGGSLQAARFLFTSGSLNSRNMGPETAAAAARGAASAARP